MAGGDRSRPPRRGRRRLAPRARRPLRLATVYLDDDNVRALLHSREAAFLAVLDRIRGRQEWGVKAFAVSRPRVRTAGEDGDDAELGPGAAYLQRKREARDRTSRPGGRCRTPPRTCTGCSRGRPGQPAVRTAGPTPAGRTRPTSC